MLESLGLKRHHDTGLQNSAITLFRSFLAESDINTIENSSGLSDEALMSGYVAGNVASFEKLYMRHKNPLLRYFIRQTSNRATAEELCQEAWQSLIRNSATYKSSAKFTTYLYHIAHSRLVDFYRKQGRQDWLTYLDDEQHYEPLAKVDVQPEMQLDKKQLQNKFKAALERLPAEQKEVLILKYESGMTVPEIAKTLAVSSEAIKSRLRYAVSKLKSYLAEYEFESVEQQSSHL